MSIEAAIYSLISSKAAITALVSDRIYPHERPQDSAVPAIEFMVDHDSGHALEGRTLLGTGLLSLNLYATTVDEIVALRDAVIPAIDCFRGTSAGIGIEALLQDGNAEMSYSPDSKTQVCAVDFAIKFQQAA
jgi:hypothetical protein